MSELLVESISITSQLPDIQKLDISHDELGVANGFHDAQKVKNKSCSYLENILTSLEKYEDALNDAIVTEKLTQIEQWYSKIKNHIKHIDNLAASGVHEANFPNQRTNFINAIINVDNELKKNLYPLELDLKLCELREKISDSDYFQEAKSKANEYVSAAEDSASKIQKVLDAVQQKTIHTGVDESAGQFAELVGHHKDHEKYWLIATAISTLTLCFTVYYAVWCMPIVPTEDQSTAYFIVAFLKRLILVSIAGVFLRISLTKYNTERGLRIVYGHRQKVLDQYLTFEAGIGDDLEAKNQFRLEIAKYIFSDPQSAYSSTGTSTGAEININPVVSAAEKYARVR